MMFERAQSMLLHTEAYPLHFAILLHDNSNVVQDALKEMSTQWKAWKQALTETSPIWKRLVRRSCFSMTAVDDIFRALEAVDFGCVPQAVQEILEKMFTGFAHTKVIEDSFQRCRRKETERPDGRMTSVDVWVEPVVQKVLSSLYHFDEVEAPEETSKDLAKRINPAVFKPKAKEVSVPEIRDLPGRGAPGWTSYTASSSSALGEEVCLLTHLFQQGQMGAVGHRWKTKLLQGGMVLQRQGKRGPSFAWGL